MLYDFHFKGFNLEQLKESFSENAKTESLTLEDFPGYPYHLFRFYDSVSRFDFLVKSFDTSEYFFIDRAQLSSNLVNFKNELHIGMSKIDFAEAMQMKRHICDTFRISDGEIASEYDFIFNADTLNTILIWAAH